MATYAQAVKPQRTQERRKLKDNPLSELVNSRHPKGLVNLESPLSAIVNQREALPLDQLPNQAESPLSAMVNQHPVSVLAGDLARDTSPMARLVNRGS